MVTFNCLVTNIAHNTLFNTYEYSWDHIRVCVCVSFYPSLKAINETSLQLYAVWTPVTSRRIFSCYRLLAVFVCSFVMGGPARCQPEIVGGLIPAVGD